MARILVTGAAGFLGGHLVEALTARGDTVTALDLVPPPAPAQGDSITADITDAAAMRSAAADHDAIIHAAAIADLWIAEPDGHDRVNHTGTEAVISAAEVAGARLVYVSSYTTLIGAETRRGQRVDESLRLAPEALLGPYPASKRRAELAIEAAAARGLPALSVLPSAPVGPGDRRPTPPGRMILDLARGATPALIDTVLDLVDVRALSAGILAALDRGEPGARYLLTGEQLTLVDLAKRIATLTGRRAPTTRVPILVALLAARVEDALGRLTSRAPTAPLTGVRLAARPVVFDTTRAAEALGWSPPPVDDALATALADFRARGLL